VATQLAVNEMPLHDLFEATVDSVYSFLAARCGHSKLAEDLTGKTYLAASARFAEGRGSEVTVAWLLTVARRRLVDHWRNEDTRRRGFSQLVDLSVLSYDDDPFRTTSVDLALESLSQRYRAALTLRYLDDFSVGEVADALGLSYKATESVLSRARAAFAKAYR